MTSILETMTKFTEKEWDLYLLGKPDEPEQNIGEISVYSILLLWSINTMKTLVKDVIS